MVTSLIQDRNHLKTGLAEVAVRSIIGNIHDDTTTRVLLIATRDVKQIFDDVDLRFVTSCTLLLSSIAKEHNLQQALQAKERFMRGITHHLRTPIHGILACAELLQSELSADMHGLVATSGSLDMIQDSGKELMRFVNSIIRFNHWNRIDFSEAPTAIVDLDTLESQILQDIPRTVLTACVSRTCVYFERKMSDGLCLASHQEQLIADCLQPLVLNAMQHTTRGNIVITYAASPDFSTLTFDVKDTGCGIAPGDQQRIFDHYEKASHDRQGSGLGLTLARKAAQLFDGTVELVASEPGEGSHFRVSLQMIFACQRAETPTPAPSFDALPKHFHVLASGPQTGLVSTFARYLEGRGHERATTPNGTLVVVEYTHVPEDFKARFSAAENALVTVSLVPHGADVSEASASYPSVMFFKCPFTSTRLMEIMASINQACERVTSSVDSQKPSLQQMCIRTQLTRLDSSMPKTTAPHCLLVDDNPINLRILCVFCEQRGYTYMKSLDGFQAIAAYKSAASDKRISLILLDLQMPNCGGIEACKTIRQYEAENALPPAVIIIVTGQDTPTDRDEAASAGADNYFVKPLAMKQLDALISQYLGYPP